MRYVLKQKMFSIGDKFTIQNEEGQDTFLINGKLFSVGKKLSFQDMFGQELAFIKQRVFSFFPTYEILRNESLAASVKKKFSFFKNRFAIELADGRCLDVEGSFLDHEYQFVHNGASIANVSKKYFSWSDTYGVDIADDQDPILVLATVVVIDMICHNGSKNSGFSIDLGS